MENAKSFKKVTCYLHGYKHIPCLDWWRMDKNKKKSVKIKRNLYVWNNLMKTIKGMKLMEKGENIFTLRSICFLFKFGDNTQNEWK